MPGSRFISLRVPSFGIIALMPDSAPEGKRGLGFRLRLLLYFAIVIVLPLGTLGVAAPILYSSGVERMSMAYTGQMIAQVTRNAEFYVKDIEKIIDFLSSRPDLRAFVGGGPGEPAAAEMESVKIARPEIAGLLVLSADDRLASRDFYRVSRDSLVKENWYAAAAAGPEVTLRRGPSAATCATSYPAPTRDRGRIQGDAGLLHWTRRPGRHRDRLESRGHTRASRRRQGGKQGLPLHRRRLGRARAWAVEPHHIPRSARLDPGNGDGTGQENQGEDYEILARTSAYTGWRTMALFAYRGIPRGRLRTRFRPLHRGGLTVAIAFLLSFLLASSVAKPVIELENLMSRAETGDFSTRFEGDETDDIGRLGRSYNAMISEIRNLIGLVYKEQHDKREAELHVLQEQIKPHFLYNTLETIRYMARKRGAADVEDMVVALTRLFRIGLSRGAETIALSDEIEHAGSYLFIQSTRYAGKFDYAIDVQDGILRPPGPEAHHPAAGRRRDLPRHQGEEGPWFHPHRREGIGRYPRTQRRGRRRGHERGAASRPASAAERRASFPRPDRGFRRLQRQ